VLLLRGCVMYFAGVVIFGVVVFFGVAVFDLNGRCCALGVVMLRGVLLLGCCYVVGVVIPRVLLFPSAVFN